MVDGDSFYVDLGRRIRSHRDRQHITQEQLGSSLDPPTSRASIANIEAGKQRVLAHTLVQLAQVLSVPLTELLPATDERATDAAVRQELANKLRLPKGRLPQVIKNLTPPKSRRTN